MKKLSDLTDWTEAIGNVVCGEATELLKMIPDKSITLVLTDPPYGIGASNVKRGGRKGGKSLARSREYGHLKWDNSKPSQKVFDEIFRISKNQIIFGGEHLSHLLPQSRGWIFWDKVTGNNRYADGELIWTSFDKALRKFTWQWKGMFQENMKNKEIRVHPTQKPVSLIQWMLQSYSNKIDLIADFFAGSFTTALACEKLNRRWIACDISEDYCRIGEQRLEDYRRQAKLF